MKCDNCTFESEGLFIYCPVCGTKVITDDVREELQKLLFSAKGPVENNKEGIANTDTYIKVVRSNLAIYAEGLSKIFEHFQAMPKFFRNKKWDKEAVDYLETLALISTAMPSREPGNIDQTLAPPQGCFFVAYNLIKIHQYTIEFSENSQKFVINRDSSYLSKVASARDKIAEHLKNALSETDKILKQLNEFKSVAPQETYQN